MNQLITNGTVGEAVEAALAEGNLRKLNTEQRVAYYNATCESLGINPLTRPFEYIDLNGKLVLYATRACTEQLRKVHKVSLNIVARDRLNDVYVVTARASTPDGRTDESTGAVSVVNLKGDALCNALMKAETKAKRRVTLSICGLGWLDETETETIPNARIVETPEAAKVANLANGGVRPSVSEADLDAIHAEFSDENPWFHRIESERSPSRGKALCDLPDSAWEKISANPAKALMHFSIADQQAIRECLANPHLRPMPEE